ncbi:MAG: cation diffusion facilitator family transporter [Psychrobacillus sp.]|uniref:cation diffusion facilitator family transporter n=1 Tax=Psychrobacillus sp. MER TA 171 TaxID=2939577 RepID=UPI00203B0FAE|nr:cation diffusion facilitator family transporter [Psychrobacillus sp. MER TA 171]MCM3357867.1 cation diffusion facilitator family transporter [Psychrobacillus sp. MER TA 171]
MELYTNLRAGEKGAYLSIVTYIVLSIFKLTAGYLGNSEALRADGLNNTTDIIASVAVLIGLRISQRPPDDDHRYGHFRAETIASLIASFIMIYVGIEVLISAVKSMTNPVEVTPDILTIFVALISAVIMFGVYKYNYNLAERIKSTAVKAAAYDNRSDAFVSIGTAVGIVAAIIGFPIIDTITAFIIGIIIIKTAIDIFKEAVYLLTDGFDSKFLAKIRADIERMPQVREITEIRGRQHGGMMLIDITISVNPNLNVRRSHDISNKIEQHIQSLNSEAVTFVHIEPYDPKEMVISEDDYHF